MRTCDGKCRGCHGLSDDPDLITGSDPDIEEDIQSFQGDIELKNVTFGYSRLGEPAYR